MPKHQPRTWNNKNTVQILLESITPLHDLRKHSHKHLLTTQNTEEPDMKICKTTEESQSSTTTSISNEETTDNIHQISTTEVEEVILHIMDSELELFLASPATSNNVQIQEDCKEIRETRRVFLNNNWQVKDTIGTTEFEGLI